MNAQRYPEEGVKQILEQGHSVADVSRRFDVSTHSLYKWTRLQQIPAAQRLEQVSQSEELRRIKAELKRVTEERDILKKRRHTSLVVRLKYAFIAKHQLIYSVVRMCWVLQLHPSGDYEWRARPQVHVRPMTCVCWVC